MTRIVTAMEKDATSGLPEYLLPPRHIDSVSQSARVVAYITSVSSEYAMLPAVCSGGVVYGGRLTGDDNCQGQAPVGWQVVICGADADGVCTGRQIGEGV